MQATANLRRVPLATLLALGLLASAGLKAQATRTWVSGVGDDANPCSRTAPCKTFAGAISKTAAGGEINALDPGGYGAVTITKSITIDGSGTQASILASLTNGIIVNAAAGDVVTIRNLSINGIGNGLNGIRFLAGKALHVENVTIFGFTQKGIDFSPSAPATTFLFVRDSQISSNRTGNTSGVGINLKPGAASSVAASIENSRLDRNFQGLLVEDRGSASLSRSVVSGNHNSGVQALSVGAAATLAIDGSVINANGSFGVLANGGLGSVQLSDTTVTGHGTGLAVATGGTIVSFGNNRIRGNTTDGSPTSTIGTN